MCIRLLFAILVAVSSMFFSDAAVAHPLGNFSVSHYSAICIGQNTVELKYILDLAEIPTFQEIQQNGITPKADDGGVQAYLARRVAMLRDGLSLQVDGKPLRVQVDSSEIIFPPGAGGLPTMKIGVLFKAKVRADAKRAERLLDYRDGNFSGRAGWKEIIVASDGGVELISSSAPATDRSRQLSDYPTDLLNSPPQQLEARVIFLLRTAAPVVAAAKNPSIAKPTLQEIPPPQNLRGTEPDASLARTSDNTSIKLVANRQATPRNPFTEMMASKQLGIGMISLALAIAVGLGALHGLEPGHGKTLVAAYLVGSRGTFKHALMLGLIVTAAHTAGVYLLGIVTLYASNYIVPERLYPWLGLISGLMIIALGSMLLLRRYRAKDGMIGHRHHGHSHHHHVHEHHHQDHAHHHEPIENVSLKQLLALGISGGIVPCPAALVVLLSAVSLQRIGFGLLLIVAFSVGLAAVLIAVGTLMVFAKRFMSQFRADGRVIMRWLPVTSSAIITAFGIGLTWQALVSVGFIQL